MSARDNLAIARALHDGIAQDLVALAYRAEILADSSALDSKSSSDLRELSRQISALTLKIREEIYQLRNGDEIDLMNEFELLSEHSPIPMTLAIADNWRDLPINTQEAIIAVAQELVRNSIRHSGASHIEVTLIVEENEATLTVADNGTSDAARLSENSDTKGFGLQGVREIARSINATFLITADHGTVACLRSPISHFL